MRESFLKLLRGERPDEIIWTADISYWLAGQPEEKVGDNGWDTEIGCLKLACELGCMPYYWYDKFWAGELVTDNVEIKTETENNTQLHIWDTPAGKLCQKSKFVEQSKSEAITKYAVENTDDLKVLLYILEHSRQIPTNIEDYRHRMKLWAEYGGLPAIAMLRSPLSAFFVELAGVQNGIYLMTDESDLVKEVLKLLEAHEEPILDALCRLSPPLVHFADNLTSEVYTGFFDDYMAQQYETRVKTLHTAGVKCAVHLDGTVSGLLPKLADVGIDAIEAITPQPAGDLPIEQIREIAANDKVILWGGVPGVMFSQPYIWNDIKKHVTKVLELWQDTPFVLGVADQVPPDGDISIVKGISELVKSWKGRVK